MRRGFLSISRRNATVTALALFTAAVLVGANCLSVGGRPHGGGGGGGGQTCTPKISGNGNEGTFDPQVQYSTDNGATWPSAFIVPPNVDQNPLFVYDVIAGTHYVSVSADRSAPENADYLFRTAFTMASGFTNPSLSVQVNCDNVATVFLNGHNIGSQTNAETGLNFKNPPDVFTTTNAAFFLVGANTLSFTVHNFTNQVALDFKADICTQTGCVDEDPPSVSCSVAINQLWPANHDLICVGLTAQVTDDCDRHCDGDDDDDDDDDDGGGHHGHGSTPDAGVGTPSSGDHHHGGDDDDDDCRGSRLTPTVKVYSDEEDLDVAGSGNFSPDAKNIGVGTLRLRAERSGNADGRVYLVVVKATDATGKIGWCVKTVTVPHDQSNASKNSVAAQATAARNYFLANHTPPPGYVQVGTGPIVGPKQ